MPMDDKSWMMNSHDENREGDDNIQDNVGVVLLKTDNLSAEESDGRTLTKPKKMQPCNIIIGQRRKRRRASCVQAADDVGDYYCTSAVPKRRRLSNRLSKYDALMAKSARSNEHFMQAMENLVSKSKAIAVRMAKLVELKEIEVTAKVRLADENTRCFNEESATLNAVIEMKENEVLRMDLTQVLDKNELSYWQLRKEEIMRSRDLLATT